MNGHQFFQVSFFHVCGVLKSLAWPCAGKHPATPCLGNAWQRSKTIGICLPSAEKPPIMSQGVWRNMVPKKHKSEASDCPSKRIEAMPPTNSFSGAGRVVNNAAYRASTNRLTVAKSLTFTATNKPLILVPTTTIVCLL
jgi:hypothetical protein